MSGEKKKILIIEDDSTLLDIYKLKFESGDFDLQTATTGEKGLELAKSQKFDLILVDLLLINKVEGGKINGFSVVKQLRQNGTTKNAKIYALTNLDQDGDIERAFKSGIDGYLIKSDFTPGELVESAKKILEGKRVGIRM